MEKYFIPVLESGDRKITFSNAGIHLVYLHNVSGSFTFSIDSPGIELHIFGLYTGRGSNAFKVSTMQIHSAPSSSSNLFIKGVFEDRSQFVYQGLIRIEKTGSGSHAYQKNQNLILSSGAFVSSKPDLEILAKDVFCTHGSTTGRPNRQIEYYMNTRGLDKKTAEKLVVAGFTAQLFAQMDSLGFTAESLRYKQLLLPDYA